MSEKMWGAEPFWGLGYDWDPDWVLTDRQQELRSTLIELCEQEMRANAKRSDDELLYPRRYLELLGEHGFLALTVPEEYGGLGENHVAFAMTCETIARYGCASTAMCYVMHMGAVQAIMLRPTPELIEKYIRPLELRPDRHAVLLRPRDRLALLVPLSSGAERAERRLQGAQEGVVDDVRRIRRLLRLQPPARTSRATTICRCSWSTGARAGPAVAVGRPRTSRQPVRGAHLRRRQGPGSQLVGPERDGAGSNDEAVDPWFLIGSSSVWNGSPWAPSTSPSATRRERGTSTSAFALPTTRRFRTTWARP